MFFQKTVAPRREAGAKLSIALSLRSAGLVAQVQADSEPAKALLEQSLPLLWEARSKTGRYDFAQHPRKFGPTEGGSPTSG